MTTIAGWAPFRGLDVLERRMRRIFEEIGIVSALLPAADTYETPDEFVVELEVPGYEEKELSIEISDHKLKVTGERTETEGERNRTFRVRERLDRKFERRFELPVEADTQHIKAVFEKGVLQVRVPKRRTGTSHKVVISKPGRPERET